MTPLAEKRVVVTGGAGFLGQHLVRTLSQRGCKQIVVPLRSLYDLTREAAVEQLFREGLRRTIEWYRDRVKQIGSKPGSGR